MTNQKQMETEEFRINWAGVAKWTIVAGLIGGAYYYGKKQGIKQEASKHQVAIEPISATEEITEI